jgi:hypothetical protein
VVAALVGHNSKAMTNRYTHIGESALQEWVQKMPKIAAREQPPAIKALPAPPALPALPPAPAPEKEVAGTQPAVPATPTPQVPAPADGEALTVQVTVPKGSYRAALLEALRDGLSETEAQVIICHFLPSLRDTGDEQAKKRIDPTGDKSGIV